LSWFRLSRFPSPIFNVLTDSLVRRAGTACHSRAPHVVRSRLYAHPRRFALTGAAPLVHSGFTSVMLDKLTEATVADTVDTFVHGVQHGVAPRY
jgi:hypothetical protein